MEQSNELFHLMPEQIVKRFKDQLLFGLMPAEIMEKIFSPILNNYNTIMSQLSVSAQKDVQAILTIYPEVTQKYNITSNDQQTSRFWNVFVQKVSRHMSRCKYFIMDYCLNPVPQLKLAVVMCSILLIIFLCWPLNQPSNSYVFKQMQQLSMIMDINLLPQPVMPQKSRSAYGLLDAEYSDSNKVFWAGFNFSKIVLSTCKKDVAGIAKDITRIKQCLSLNDSELNRVTEKPVNLLNLKQLETIIMQAPEIQGNMPIYHLGQWCALSRAVVLSENIEAIRQMLENQPDFQAFIGKSTTIVLPKGVVNSLIHIQQIKTDELTDRKISLLNKKLDLIVRLMRAE